ncbi:hypothetical protein MesoLj113b_29360 [Mesorhizobium sp. 113-3-3]|nr:hypothetical protein MesoLj113b_29360 [Mesorhizobium sp. 113-3-3]
MLALRVAFDLAAAEKKIEQAWINPCKSRQMNYVVRAQGNHFDCPKCRSRMIYGSKERRESTAFTAHFLVSKCRIPSQ